MYACVHLPCFFALCVVSAAIFNRNKIFGIHISNDAPFMNMLYMYTTFECCEVYFVPMAHCWYSCTIHTSCVHRCSGMISERKLLP